MAKAKFIISLDCEGKWGVSDHLSSLYKRDLTNENLTNAYENIVRIFQDNEISATFAFVGAMLMSKKEVEEKLHLFSDGSQRRQQWISPFLDELGNGVLDGWLNPGLLDVVERVCGHEVAIHGFSHLPIVNDAEGREDFNIELAAIRKVDRLIDKDLPTLIYPRNLIQHPDLLGDFGIIGYRGSPAELDSSIKNKLAAVVGGNPVVESINLESGDHPMQIPGGTFLHWRYGIRKLGTVNRVVAKWKKAIEKAVDKGGVLHMWTHPHNFITGDSQYELLDRIVRIVNNERLRGKLDVVTQEQYCRQLVG